MQTPKPPKKVKAPEGIFIDITAGKEYDVLDIWADYDEETGYGFRVKNDIGNEAMCIEIVCVVLLCY